MGGVGFQNMWSTAIQERPLLGGLRHVRVCVLLHVVVFVDGVIYLGLVAHEVCLGGGSAL